MTKLKRGQYGYHSFIFYTDSQTTDTKVKSLGYTSLGK